MSSTHAVSTAAIASAIVRTVLGFRPSLKLGTHSTSGCIFSLTLTGAKLHYDKMPSDRFISQRKNAWQRLEDLLKLLDHASLRRLGREEVRELGRIYRRTASDLAIARAESRDPRLVNYLNSLVIRAHGRIYRADAQGGKRIRRYFTHELPQTFRRTWAYTFVAFATFALFGVLSFVATKYDPDFSELVGVDPAFRELYIETKTHWWESLNQSNQVGASAIMTNNIQVTIYTFAFGALAGVGTLFYMAFNGANIASVLALTYKAGFGNDLVTFMVAHGVVELSCIFIAGGAGLLIGSAMIMPGNLTRSDALRTRGMEAVRLMIGVALLLVVAGTIEGFVSPAAIDPRIKYSIAALTGLALYSYLLFVGHEPAPQTESE
ncbi:MAG TPA: stage II sporulation protein M [Pyrinomonadaceae bacterium]|nr:stage II sporulation protein M [Pyrinomonadaceae bacterium]